MRPNLAVNTDASLAALARRPLDAGWLGSLGINARGVAIS